MPDQNILTLRQVDQAKTDFALVESNLELIMAQLARIPTRKEQARNGNAGGAVQRRRVPHIDATVPTNRPDHSRPRAPAASRSLLRTTGTWVIWQPENSPPREIVGQLKDAFSPLLPSAAALIEGVEFASDSPLEGPGFEPSVPRPR